MTVPNGAAGVTVPLFGVSAAGNGNISITDLVNQTEDAVRNTLADKYVNNGNSVLSDPSSVLGQVFGGLSGLPGMLAALLTKLTGVDLTHLTTVGDLIAAVEHIPGISQIVGVIKQLTGVDLNTIFDGIDLDNPGAVVTAIEAAVQNLVKGLIQNIIDSITSGLNKSASTGNDPLSIILGFLNPVNDINNIKNSLLTISGNLQAMIAGLQGQVTVANANIATLATATSSSVASSGTDNFNRASGDIGTNWTTVTGTGRLQITTAFSDGFVRTSRFSAGYFNAGNPATDKHGAQVRLTAKSAGGCRVYICADAALSNFAAAEIRADPFGNDYIALVTGSSPNVVITHQIQPYSFFSLQDNCLIDIRYDPTANTFSIYKDAAAAGTPPILSWTDNNNIITHGASKRLCPIASNTDNNLFLIGPGITDYKYYDWT